ncbi:MAG: sulfite exporter TauE/SafE family protein [Bacteroidetes bacterium]|nr:MAG: sulfite exporter TauE/SafE family protein [Bacteroidota bacterium]TAG86279.1 MAG: sulfite exporter TauE/SafE family protein [Bacteroidota bacterium]
MALYIFLFFAVVFASVFSALFGLAGGTMILAVLSWTLGIKNAVPLHSAVQFVGNVARLGVYYKLVVWKIVGYFIILTLPGAYLGGLCIDFLSEKWLELSVGIFILLTIFMPKPSFKNGIRYEVFALLGFLGSFLGMIVAVSGPFIASFFILNNIKKEEMIATKSVCQGITQIAKLIIFASVVHFSFDKFWFLLLILSLAAIIGTLIGRYLIEKISENVYNTLNNWLLGSIASLMILGALSKIIN